jgi:hypothetical protein
MFGVYMRGCLDAVHMLQPMYFEGDVSGGRLSHDGALPRAEATFSHFWTFRLWRGMLRMQDRVRCRCLIHDGVLLVDEDTVKRVCLARAFHACLFVYSDFSS